MLYNYPDSIQSFRLLSNQAYGKVLCMCTVYMYMYKVQHFQCALLYNVRRRKYELLEESYCCHNLVWYLNILFLQFQLFVWYLLYLYM